MNASSRPVIAICIATYKRPKLLLNTIKAITQIHLPEEHKVVVIVVDNDKEGTAGTVIETINHPEKDNIYYFIEPVRGLSSVRNRLLDEAIKINSELIAFIDDDEFPHPSWLVDHLYTLYKYNVDIVSGPVIATYEMMPSNNIKVHVKHSTGHIPRHIAANNVLFKCCLINKGRLKFDPYYNFIGGEDFDFFDRAVTNGFTKIWCAEAIVYETITEERRTKKYLFFRPFTGAINNVLSYKNKKSTLSAWGHFLIKLTGKAVNSLMFILAYLFTFDKKYLKKSIVNIASAIGYLSGLLNIVVERYR